MEFGTLIVLVALAFLLFTIAGQALRIVPEYQRLVVFRLGRVIGARGPGLVVLIPFVDRGQRVDLREVFFDVEPQTTITKDNAPLSIDFLVYLYYFCNTIYKYGILKTEEFIYVFRKTKKRFSLL